MLASVHIADVGARQSLKLLRRAPEPLRTPGLRSADIALVTPLAGTLRRIPKLGRVGLVAFWDDDSALDRFLAEDERAARFAGGWQVRLTPIRMYGGWPGMPAETPSERNVPHDGPLAVLTLARFRLRRMTQFFRTSVKAEAAALQAPGMIWGTAMAKPPFVATCSLWESTRAIADYAYGREPAAHPAAVNADRADPFHHQSAFLRFQPYASSGQLSGPNPLAADWLTGVTAQV
jgi:hypothetical protein